MPKVVEWETPSEPTVAPKPEVAQQTVTTAAPARKSAARKDPKAELAKTLAILEDKIGKGMVHPANQSPQVHRTPFVNPHLNYITDGGAPWDRYMSLIGDPSTGKTLAAYELILNGQRLPYSADSVLVPRIAYHQGLGHDKIVARLKEEQEWTHDNFPDGAECVFHDIEGQFDKTRAAQIGIDVDRLYLSELNVIEDIGIALSGLFKHFHVHVLDSTSNATSLLSLKQEPGKSLVGTDARQWKNVLRDANTYFGSSKNGTGIPNAVVMVHQMSTNIKTGGQEQATGRYVKFISSLTIKFNRAGFLWDKDGVLTDKKVTGADDVSMAGRAEADGLAVIAQVEKSRTCRPFKVGALQFDYRKLTYTAIHQLATSGLYFGYIIKSGSWFSIPGESENLGQGMKSVYARLADDEDLRDKIMCRLMDNSDEE